jgi:hypothetical protein
MGVALDAKALVKRRTLRAATAALLVSSAVVTASVTAARADTTETLTVNFGSSTGSPPGYYGAGLLSGINPSFPDAANVAPIHVPEWRFGDPAYISLTANPPYDYFSVYPTVNNYAPAQTEAIASDFNQTSPYSSMSWQTMCDTLASTASADGQHPTWDLMNEPDLESWTWLSSSATDWDNCYTGVRTGDPSALIAGPSISSDNLSNIETFLLDQKAKGKLPDVVTWHFSAPQNLQSDVSTIQGFMSSNGISARPIVVQEVTSSSDADNPGEAVDYFAAAERAQVTVGHACWQESGLPSGAGSWTCDEPMLDGLLDNTENRRGEWYAYADYSAMTGDLVSASSSDQTRLDGLATANSTTATVLVGANDNWGGGTADIDLTGLGSLSFLSGSSGSVRVAVQSMPSGTSPATQTLVSNTSYSYTGGSLTIPITMAQYSAARVTITATSGNLVNSSWDDVGGVLTDSPAIASTGTNNLYAFVRGDDGALYATTYNGTSWASWSGGSWSGSAGDLGGPTSGTFVGAPSAIAWGGKVTVAVRGTDNALWIDTLSGGSWSGWTSLGGTLTSSPTITSQNSSDLEVFIRGSDDGLWQDSYNGSSWSGWGSLGAPSSGTFINDPSATSRSNGVITVYVDGANHQVYEKYWVTATGWSGWNSTGSGTLTSSPDVSAESSTNESIFGRSSSGALVRDTWTSASGWSGWNTVGGGGPTYGVMSGTPATVSWASGRTDVLVWSADGPLYHLTTS